GAYLHGDELRLRLDGRDEPIAARADSPLRGRHNLANTLAACAVALACAVPPAAMRAGLRAFRGLPHRLELVATLGGVGYHDGSIAPSRDRGIAALRVFEEPRVVIAGGRDKPLPLDDWAALLARRARYVVLLGEASDLVAAALGRAAPHFRTIS